MSSDGAGVYTSRDMVFFCRMHGAELGHHQHHIARAYLVCYARESACREDHRWLDDGRQLSAVAG